MTIEPPGEGWLPWSDPQATERLPEILAKGGCVETWRAEWGNQTAFMTWQDLGPGLDVRGLWWRPA
jgi:hypothetical protein